MLPRLASTYYVAKDDLDVMVSLPLPPSSRITGIFPLLIKHLDALLDTECKQRA